MGITTPASWDCPKDNTRQCVHCTCRLSTSQTIRNHLGGRRECAVSCGADRRPGHISLPSLASAPELNDLQCSFWLLIAQYLFFLLFSVLRLSRRNWVLSGSFLVQPILFTSFITKGEGGGGSNTNWHSSNIVDIQSHLRRQVPPSLEVAKGGECNRLPQPLAT